MQIDARGMGCPKPVILAEEALSRMVEGTLEVLVDNDASVENLKRFATRSGLYAESARTNSHWQVRITKSYMCETYAQEDKSAEREKNLLVVIATDTMGKDEKLGRILMKAFFETMKVTGELPHTIFLMNTAVRFTTTDEEMMPLMKDFAEMGVEVFTCGTCLKHFDLEGNLRVGYRGTTNHFVEGLKDFGKTVWIG